MADHRRRALHVTDERLQAAVEVCGKAGAEIVYLFGSRARGRPWAVDTAPLRETQNRYLREAIQARAAALDREEARRDHIG